MHDYPGFLPCRRPDKEMDYRKSIIKSMVLKGDSINEIVRQLKKINKETHRNTVMRYVRELESKGIVTEEIIEPTTGQTEEQDTVRVCKNPKCNVVLTETRKAGRPWEYCEIHSITYRLTNNQLEYKRRHCLFVGNPRGDKAIYKALERARQGKL